MFTAAVPGKPLSGHSLNAHTWIKEMQTIHAVEPRQPRTGQQRDLKSRVPRDVARAAPCVLLSTCADAQRQVSGAGGGAGAKCRRKAGVAAGLYPGSWCWW